MVSDEIHTKLETILKEMEQEFIILRFKFSTPVGKNMNEICGVPGLGSITTSLTRDKMMMATILLKMCKMRRLLRYPREEITSKRVAALRQHYFMIVHKNRCFQRGRYVNWNYRSADFCAGSFLLAIFDKHISYEDRQ